MTMTARRLTRRLLAAAALLATAGAPAALGGCYHHVVRAEGPGQSNYTVHEPNYKEDEPLFGPFEDGSRKRK